MILSRVLGGLLLIAVGLLGLQTYRLDAAQDKYTEFKAAMTDKLVEAYRANETERSAAEQALVKASQEYLRGKRDAELLEQDARASLLADNARVRKHWREAIRRAEQAEASGTNSGGNGEADAMREDIAAVLRDAAESDARTVQLQNRIDTYLKQVNGVGYYERYQSFDWRRDSERLAKTSFGLGASDEGTSLPSRPRTQVGL